MSSRYCSHFILIYVCSIYTLFQPETINATTNATTSSGNAADNNPANSIPIRITGRNTTNATTFVNPHAIFIAKKNNFTAKIRIPMTNNVIICLPFFPIFIYRLYCFTRDNARKNKVSSDIRSLALRICDIITFTKAKVNIKKGISFYYVYNRSGF